MRTMSQSGPSLWTPLPQSAVAPCDRYKHACCSYDGHVYVLGGRENGSLRDFWKYSVAYNEWTELNCSNEASPEELEQHTMVAHQGFLYVFGGMLDSAYSKCRCALWVFEIAKQKWVHCQGKRSLPQSQMPTNRKGHSAVVMGSAMLMYGGFVDIKGSSQDFWRLDFDTMSWSLLSGPQHDSLGPGPRHSHSATTYQGCMYLFGGLKGLKEQRDFWKYNSTSSVWSALKNKLGPPRLMGHSAVAYRDSMLLFGGGESLNSPQSCLWRYSFSTHSWSQVAFLPGSTPPSRIQHCCVGLGPSYHSTASNPCCSPGLLPRLLDSKYRPFKNKCFPAPLTFLGSEGAIELETFSLDKFYESRTKRSPSKLDHGVDVLTGKVSGSCLTFENKAFRKQCSCSEEEEMLEEKKEDITQHLPDLLLVLGGRPCSTHSPISIWQMTLTDS